MKLNWFSPLPPASTGIAHYTTRLLPALSARAEIVVWTEQAKWDARAVAGVEVRRYRPEQLPWDDLNRADLTVYHIGNNHLFHGAIWQVSRRHPGLVVLHDLCLHQLFYHIYVEQEQSPYAYLELIGKYYGAVARQDVAGRLSHLEQQIYHLSEQYPLTPHALENALGVVTHAPAAFTQLQRENRWPIAYAPLPFPAPARGLPSAVATTARGDGPPYCLIIFGYLGRNRQLNIILRALAEFPQREQLRLDIYGELAGQEDWLEEVRALRLKPLVRLHGFVPEAKLDAALASAHLAINLRHPTMGEASLSQLRLWSHALPSLVSQAGWYASLPADAVAHVRPNCEVEDLHAHWRDLLDDPARFRHMGERGRELLERQHAPELYAESLLQLVPLAQRFRPLWAARQLAGRAGLRLAELFSPELPSMAPGGVGEAIFELFADDAGKD